MTEVVALISTYEDFHAALRARAEQLGVSRETIDAMAGLPSGYASKVLAPKPMKRIGPTSLPLLVPALGMQLALIEDPAAMQRLAKRRVQRDGAQVRSDAVHLITSKRFLRKIGGIGGAASRSNLSKRKTRSLAQKAARARWAKHSPAKPVAARSKP